MTRTTLRLALGLAALLAARPALAQTNPYTWQPTTSANWNVTTSWRNGNNVAEVPPSTAATQLLFTNNATYTATNNIGAFTLNSMTFGGTGAKTVAGTFVITFDGASPALSVNSGAGAVTVSSALAYNTATAVTNNSTSLLTLSGAQTLTAAVTFGGPGDTAVSGAIGAGTFTKTGSGVLTLSSTSNLYNNVAVNGGTIAFGGATGTGGASGNTFTLADNTTLRFAAGFTTTTTTHVFSVAANAATTFDIQNGALVSVLGNHLVGTTGTINVNGNGTSSSVGTLTVGSSGTMTIGQTSGGVTLTNAILRFSSQRSGNAGNFVVGSGSALYLLDTTSFSTATPFALASGKTVTLNGDGPLAGNGIGATTIRGAYLHNLDEAGSAVTSLSPGFVLATTSRFTLANTAATAASRTAADTITDTFNGVISGPGGLILDGQASSTMVIANAATYLGSTTVASGTLRISGAANRLPTGTTLVLGGDGTANTPNTAGTFDLNGLSQTVAGLTTAGTGLVSTSTFGTVATNTYVTTALAGNSNRVITSAAGTPTLTVNLATGTQTFAGVLGGTGTNNNAFNLVKAGGGTLSLTGTSTYTGSTAVTAGTLRVTTNATARPYTVADAAGLTFANADPTAAFATSTLTLGTGGATALGFEINGAQPTAAQPLATVGTTLTANGTVNVAVSSASPLTVGQFPLIDYTGTIGGAGLAAFSGGTLALPFRTVATLVNNTANTSVDLNVTGVDFIRWNGDAAGGVWDVGTTANFRLNSNNTPTTYQQGPGGTDAPVFDDTATGTTTVVLNTAVAPAGTTFNNSTLNYTVQGTGGIGGTAAFTKSGTGSLTLAVPVTTTGLTTHSGGTLTIASGGSVAGNVAQTGGTLTVNSGGIGGSLTLSGGTATLNAGGIGGALTQSGGAVTINAAGVAGAVTLTGGTLDATVANSTTSGVSITNALYRATNPTGSATGTATVNVGTGGTLQLGTGGTAGSVGGTVTVNGGTLAFNRSDAMSFAGPTVAGAATVAQNGTGTVTLTSNLPLGTNPLTVTGPGNLTINLAVTGTGAITKNGTGTTTLLGSSTYTGPITINGGVLQVNDTGGGGDLNTALITINANGKLLFGPNGNPDFPASTAIEINGGEAEFAVGEGYGGTRLTSGVLRLTNAGINSAGGAVAFNGNEFRSGSIIATGTGATIDGATAKTTAGTVTITGTVTYGAATAIDIQEGVLSFQAANVPLTTGTLNVGTATTAGTFRLANAAAATSPRTVTLGAGGAVFDVADPAGRLTLSGALGGAGLTKTGPGTLALTGTLGQTGTSTVSAGTLAVNPGTSSGGFAVAAGATFAVNSGAATATFTTPTLDLGAGGNTVRFDLTAATAPTVPLLTVGTANGLTNAGTATLQLNPVSPLPDGTYTLIAYTGAPITSGYTLALPGRSLGTLNYDTANSVISTAVTTDSVRWTGAVNGTWDTGTAAGVGGTNNWQTVAGGAATNFVAGDKAVFDDAATTFAVTIPATVLPQTLTVNNTVAYTFNGAGDIGGSTALAKSGSGTLTIQTANTYTGGTTIAGGTVVADNATGSATGTGAVNVTGGGTLQLGTGGTAGIVAGAIALNNGTLAFNRTDAVSLANPLTVAGPAGLTQNGTGLVTLPAALPLGANPLTIDGPGNLTFGLALSGTGAITKNGAGTTTLLGSSPYTGPITINGGTLLLNDLGAGGDLNASLITVNDGGKFTFGPSGNADFPDSTYLVINAGGEAEFQQGEQFGGTRLAGGTLRLTNSTATANGAGGPFTGNVLESGTIVGTGAAASLTGTAGFPVTKTTAGTVTITGPVTYTAGTAFAIQEGTVSFQGVNVPATGTGVLTVGGPTTAATFLLSDAATAGVARPVTLGAGGATVNVADPAGALTLSGVVSGAGVVKAGPGTLTLTGANTYTGATTVAGGRLNVNGGQAAATGAVGVANGAVLAGTGTVGGAVTANGTVRGGVAGAGTLTLAGGLTLADGSTLRIDLADGSTPAAANTGTSTLGTLPNPTSNSYLNVTGGAAAIAAGVQVSVTATAGTYADTATYSYLVGGGFGDQSALAVTSPTQFTFTGLTVVPGSASLTGTAGGAVYLNFTAAPVPEPATVFGVAAAGLAAAARLRRRVARAAGAV